MVLVKVILLLLYGGNSGGRADVSLLFLLVAVMIVYEFDFWL